MEVFVVRTISEAKEAIDKLSQADVLGCDTETSGLSPRHGRLFSIQFSDGKFNVLVPLSEGVDLGLFAQLLADQDIIKIFHNARFDLDFLTAVNVQVNNVYDTMIAEKVLTKGARQSASLADTLYRYFAVDLDKSPRKKFNKKWDGVWTDELVNYALADVTYLPELREKQLEWMQKLDLTSDFTVQMQRVLSLLTNGGKPDDLL